MTVYGFTTNPRSAAIDAVKAIAAARLPAGTTVSSAFPASLTQPHVQVDWDGTPAEEQQREFAVVRVTAWGPKGAVTATERQAGIVRAYLLANGVPGAWRVTRGAGRLPGIDQATQLPFCSFTVTVETRPVALP